ncbi:MAG: tRNA lysidine(34) synthetase TilS [Clostridiales bacterium]|jgi:tRNA(Ile)-lysidine synthase|nr:tRNA lysidine(34) synthetase TilS [Clostridiales bacterium]
MSEDLPQRVQRELARLHLRSCDMLLVAVSGGADSVALLSLLDELRAGCFCLRAAHLNHGIRADAAEEDARFVEGLCAALGIPLTVRIADVPRLAKERGLTLEEAAREARYTFLREERARLGARYIALAHHMNDQAETVLMHMLRGAGPAGLCGMQIVSGDLFRPLLGATREEIEAYTRQKGLCYRTDGTNFETEYTRNRIRLRLIPQLQHEYNPQIVGGLSRMAALLAQDEAYLNEEARRALDGSRTGENEYDRDRLGKLPYPIQSRALKLALADVGALYDMRQSGIARLCGLLHARTGAMAPLPRGGGAWVSYDKIRFGHPPAAPRDDGEETPLCWPGETVFGGAYFFAEIVPGLKAEGGFTAYMDADKLPIGAVVRRRRPGDMFFALNAPGRRKLKAYLIDKKVPRDARQTPLIAGGDAVLYFPGGTVSHDVRVDENTKTVLRIVYKPQA